MASYRFLYLSDLGSIERESVFVCDNDDAALDRAGESHHPKAIWVVQGDRTVAVLPPWSPSWKHAAY